MEKSNYINAIKTAIRLERIMQDLNIYSDRLSDIEKTFKSEYKKKYKIISKREYEEEIASTKDKKEKERINKLLKQSEIIEDFSNQIYRIKNFLSDIENYGCDKQLNFIYVLIDLPTVFINNEHGLIYLYNNLVNENIDSTASWHSLINHLSKYYIPEKKPERYTAYTKRNQHTSLSELEILFSETNEIIDELCTGLKGKIFSLTSIYAKMDLKIKAYKQLWVRYASEFVDDLTNGGIISEQ